MLPSSFNIEAYLGVIRIIATGLALTGTITLARSNATAAWALALVVGLMNPAGYVLTRLLGLPLAQSYVLHRWSEPQALAAALLGAAVAGLAAWTLHARRGLPPASKPVTSARERELLLRSARRSRPSDPARPGGARKISSKSHGSGQRAERRRYVTFPAAAPARIRTHHPPDAPAGFVAHHLDR
jgi:hypothetical protein